MTQYKILNSTAKYAMDYLEQLPQKRVFPDKESLQQLDQLSASLPDEATDMQQILDQLYSIGSQNTVASNGGRYFGFVFGGTLPASLAASWLVSAWDQNAVFKLSSPITAHVEKITSRWLLELLQLPH